MTIQGYDRSKLDSLIFREILIVPSQPKLSLPRNLDSFPEVKLFFFGQPWSQNDGASGSSINKNILQKYKVYS